MGRNVPLIISVIFIAVTLELVLSVPVSITTNGRALRSVTLQRRSNWDENPVTNLLLAQQAKAVNSSLEPVFAQRENNTGNGDGSSTLVGDGSNDAEGSSGDGVDGTFSNDTQVGSRLSQNETEPCSLDPAILCTSDPPHSNRDKQRRIAHIVNYLWTNLFGNRTRPVNRERTRDIQLTPVNPSSSSSFSGGLQSIKASCDLPTSVESEAWESDRYFNLFFNLTTQYPDVFGTSSQTSENASLDQQQQSLESGQSHEYLPMIGSRPLVSTLAIAPKKSVNVISAKLRLYKIGTLDDSNVQTLTALPPSEPCNDTDSIESDDDGMPSVFPTKMTFPDLSPSADEKIRVSVFWYTAPVTKNHYKKKLVDAKMLSVRESSWVEFDIKNSVKAWLNDRNPNFGLVVEVENENQDALDPRRYFRGGACFRQSSEGASQNDIGRNKPETSTGDINTSTPSSSPMIEICTLNVPEATSTNYEQTKFFPYSMNINSLNHLQRVAESHAKSSSNNASQSSTSSRYPWQNINLPVLSPEDFGIDASAVDRSSDSEEMPKPTTTVIVPSHRHRHHHHQSTSSQNNNDNNSMRHHSGSTDHQQGQQHHQRNRSRFTHPRGEFSLDEDHPLREILASVNGNSKESSRQRGSSSSPSGTHQFSESLGKGSQISEMSADDSRVGVDVDSTEHERDVFITKIVITPAQLKENGLSGIAGRRGFFPFSTLSSLSSIAPTDSTSTGAFDR